MSITTSLRVVLVLAAVLATAGVAEAKPRRIVVLEFDGPKTLADSSRSAVITVLAEQYDLVSAKRWLDARAETGRGVHGDKAWSKASKQVGVDAVVEGWVQDEARTKVLSLVVIDASNGKELDHLTIKLAGGTVGAETQRALRKGLDDRLDFIESLLVDRTDDLPPYKPEPVKPREPITGPTAPVIGPQPPPPTTPQVTETALAPPSAEQHRSTIDVLRPDPIEIGQPAVVPHIPRKTAKVLVSAGGVYESRSINVGAENPDGITQYASVPNKGLVVDARFYPFPTKKLDGTWTGVGFHFNIGHSLGSTVTFDDGEAVGDYTINQSSWNAGVHYRVALGQFAIDGEVGYGHSNYTIVDAPETFEVPDTAYSYLTAGAHLDLAITDHASVGFGAKYLHVLDAGDLTSTEWYGPGDSSGFVLDGGFVVPLPKDLFVQSRLAYTRIKTSFDGVGVITEEEGAFEATDSTISGTLTVGIKF